MRAACLIFVIAAAVAGPARTAAAQLGEEGDAIKAPPGRRSPGKAMILSAVVPALAVAAGTTMMAHGGDSYELGAFTAFAGGVFGPSAGLWYGGHRGGLGILARGSAAAIVAYGGRVAYADDMCEDCDELERDKQRRTGQRLMYAGAALWVLSTINDIRTAERTTQAWNSDRDLRASGVRPPALSGRRGRSPEAAMALTLLMPAATIAWGKVMLTSDDLKPLGWMTIGYGVVMAPSTGIWYAGNPGGKGMTIRTLIGIGMLVGGAKAFDDDFCDFAPRTECLDQHRRDVREGRIVFGISTALWATSVLYDMRSSARLTGKWNARRGLLLSPTVFPTNTGRAPGMVLSTTF